MGAARRAMAGSKGLKGVISGQVEYGLRLAEAERLGREYRGVAAPVTYMLRQFKKLTSDDRTTKGAATLQNFSPILSASASLDSWSNCPSTTPWVP